MGLGYENSMERIGPAYQDLVSGFLIDHADLRWYRSLHEHDEVGANGSVAGLARQAMTEQGG